MVLSYLAARTVEPGYQRVAEVRYGKAAQWMDELQDETYQSELLQRLKVKAEVELMVAMQPVEAQRSVDAKVKTRSSLSMKGTEDNEGCRSNRNTGETRNRSGGGVERESRCEQG